MGPPLCQETLSGNQCNFSVFGMKKTPSYADLEKLQRSSAAIRDSGILQHQMGPIEGPFVHHLIRVF